MQFGEHSSATCGTVLLYPGDLLSWKPVSDRILTSVLGTNGNIRCRWGDFVKVSLRLSWAIWMSRWALIAPCSAISTISSLVTRCSSSDPAIRSIGPQLTPNNDWVVTDFLSNSNFPAFLITFISTESYELCAPPHGGCFLKELHTKVVRVNCSLLLPMLPYKICFWTWSIIQPWVIPATGNPLSTLLPETF